MSEPLPDEARETALTPIAGGRQLRTSTGQGAWKMVPPAAQPLAFVLFATPVALIASGGLGVMATGVDMRGCWMYFLLLGGGSLILAIARQQALAAWCTRLANWRLRRLAALQVTAGLLRGTPLGALVRLIGTVRATEPFTSAVMGKPAVFAVYGTDQAYLLQVRGIDFMLEVEGEESVRVAVQDAYLDDGLREETSAPADIMVGCAGWAVYREARISPGDRVEAIGLLVREVDPTLAAPPGRQPPLRSVIRAGPRTPLLLRRLPTSSPSGVGSPLPRQTEDPLGVRGD